MIRGAARRFAEILRAIANLFRSEPDHAQGGNAIVLFQHDVAQRGFHRRVDQLVLTQCAEQRIAAHARDEFRRRPR